MAVMARPQKQPFVVSAEKAKLFSSGKTSKEDWAEIKANAQNFEKNNLHKKIVENSHQFDEKTDK